MKNITYKNKKAVAILRVSSFKQKDGLSHDVQAEAVKRYAEEEKLQLVKIYTIAESAKKSADRRKYREAMDYVADENIGNVLFYLQDRESRNLTDLEENEESIKNGDFNIHYVRDRKILHRESPDSDFLNRAINGVLAREYVRTLTTRVVDAMDRKAETGWYPSNQVPLGYVCQKAIDPETGRIKNRGGTIGLDPLEKNQKIVLREFELRAQGYSFEKICETIKGEGLLSPKQLRNYRHSAIENRIKNPFYRGQFMWRGKLYKGKHELFIPTQHLEKVDELLGLRGSGVRRAPNEFTVLAGGWLRCASCGCHIVYDPKTKTKKETGEKMTYHYYHCSNGKNAHESMRGLNLTDQKIWDQFGGLIENMSISPDFAKDIADALNQLEKTAHKTVEKQIRELNKKLHELEDQEDRLTDLLLCNTLDQEAYKRKLDQIRSNRADLVKQLETYQKSLTSAIVETAASVLELSTSAKSLWNNKTPQQRREFLDMILSNPTLNGVSIEYNLRKPYLVLMEMKQEEKWCTREDSNL